MRLFAAAFMSFLLLASAIAQTNQPIAKPTPPAQSSQTISIARSGSRPSQKGPAENFTGSVRVDPLIQAIAPSRLSGGSVTFEPGARSAWHSHPLGQTLIVTAGVGRVQNWGDAVEEIRQGDVVRIPPNVKHWHGASPTAAMTHIALVEQLDGKSTDWMEKVSDEQYNAPIPPQRTPSVAGNNRPELLLVRETKAVSRLVKPLSARPQMYGGEQFALLANGQMVYSGFCKENYGR